METNRVLEGSLRWVLWKNKSMEQERDGLSSCLFVCVCVCQYMTKKRNSADILFLGCDKADGLIFL